MNHTHSRYVQSIHLLQYCIAPRRLPDLNRHTYTRLPQNQDPDSFEYKRQGQLMDNQCSVYT